MEKRFVGAFEGAANSRNFLWILWILNIDVIGERYWQGMKQLCHRWPQTDLPNYLFTQLPPMLLDFLAASSNKVSNLLISCLISLV